MRDAALRETQVLAFATQAKVFTHFVYTFLCVSVCDNVNSCFDQVQRNSSDYFVFTAQPASRSEGFGHNEKEGTAAPTDGGEEVL